MRTGECARTLLQTLLACGELSSGISSDRSWPMKWYFFSSAYSTCQSADIPPSFSRLHHPFQSNSSLLMSLWSYSLQHPYCFYWHFLLFDNVLTDFSRCGVTTGAKQSWNYEWVWNKRTFEGLCSNPMLKVGPVLPSLLVAFVHLAFWYLQGWQFLCLSGSVSWYLTTP